jgi:hypothetical protein
MFEAALEAEPPGEDPAEVVGGSIQVKMLPVRISTSEISLLKFAPAVSTKGRLMSTCLHGSMGGHSNWPSSCQNRIF